MSIEDGIRKYGFRRWYDRRLIEGHAYLVTGFLSLIMMAIALEVIQFRESLGGFAALLAVGSAGAMLCLFAWRQFTRLLGEAEHLAGQAVCSSCHAYAKFTIVTAAAAPDAVEGRALDVRCRACSHTWTIG